MNENLIYAKRNPRGNALGYISFYVNNYKSFVTRLFMNRVSPELLLAILEETYRKRFKFGNHVLKTHQTVIPKQVMYGKMSHFIVTLGDDLINKTTLDNKTMYVVDPKLLKRCNEKKPSELEQMEFNF